MKGKQIDGGDAREVAKQIVDSQTRPIIGWVWEPTRKEKNSQTQLSDTLMDLIHLAKSSGEVIKDRSQHNRSHRPL